MENSLLGRLLLSLALRILTIQSLNLKILVDILRHRRSTPPPHILLMSFALDLGTLVLCKISHTTFGVIKMNLMFFSYVCKSCFFTLRSLFHQEFIFEHRILRVFVFFQMDSQLHQHHLLHQRNNYFPIGMPGLSQVKLLHIHSCFLLLISFILLLIIPMPISHCCDYSMSIVRMEIQTHMHTYIFSYQYLCAWLLISGTV